MKIFSYDSLFGRFMNRLVDVLVLGILVIGCSIPIITIGASLSALYYTTLKMVRGDDTNVASLFFRGFKDNFWKGTALWLIVAAVMAVLYVDYALLYQREMALESAEWIMMFIITGVLALIGGYVFPLQAQFENSVGRTLKNSFLVSIMNLPRSFLILLIKLSPILVWMFYPEAMYILIFFCVAGLPYLETEILVKVFAKYMPEQEERDDDSFAPIPEPLPQSFSSGDEED